MLDEDNPFNDTMKTEDIFLDDNLFDDTDQKEIKKSFGRCPSKYKLRPKQAVICRFTWGMALKSKNGTRPRRCAICRFTWRTTRKSKKKKKTLKITPNACLEATATKI